MAHVAGVALVALAVIAAITGADVAAHSAGSSIPDFPLVYGELTPATAGPVTVAWRHRAAALLAVSVALVVAVGHSRRTSSAPTVRWVAWTSVVLAIGNTWLAARHVPLPMTRVETVAHAAFGWGLAAAGGVLFACRDGAWRGVSHRAAAWLAGLVIVDAAGHAGGGAAGGASFFAAVVAVLAVLVTRGRAPWVRRGYLAVAGLHVVSRGMSGWTTWAISPTLHAASSGVLLLGAVTMALRRMDRN